ALGFRENAAIDRDTGIGWNLVAIVVRIQLGMYRDIGPCGRSRGVCDSARILHPGVAVEPDIGREAWEDIRQPGFQLHVGELETAMFVAVETRTHRLVGIDTILELPAALAVVDVDKSDDKRTVTNLCERGEQI